MTSSEAIAFFGSEEAASKAAGCGNGSFKFCEHIRPMLQMRVFIASNGAVEMDDALIDLILQVAKVENNKRLSRNTYDPKGNNDE